MFLDFISVFMELYITNTGSSVKGIAKQGTNKTGLNGLFA
jgi:hypothetical protein